MSGMNTHAHGSHMMEQDIMYPGCWKKIELRHLCWPLPISVLIKPMDKQQ